MKVVMLTQDPNPFYDPAVLAAAVCFVLCLLMFSACGLWLLKRKSKGTK